VHGSTFANSKLAADTYNALSPMATSDLSCPKIEYVDVTPVNHGSFPPSDIPGIKGRDLSYATEKWVAHGCNKAEGFEVSFAPMIIRDGYNYTFKRLK
jgi:hypothetical protein